MWAQFMGGNIGRQFPTLLHRTTFHHTSKCALWTERKRTSKQADMYDNLYGFSTCATTCTTTTVGSLGCMRAYNHFRVFLPPFPNDYQNLTVSCQSPELLELFRIATEPFSRLFRNTNSHFLGVSL